MFSRKLQDGRRARGLSQEALAERLGVSRQAVAKWESGQCLPEVETLVALADLLGTSLDHLVRNAGPCAPGSGPTPGLGDTDAVISFLLRAKRATYAGHGAEVAPCRPGSHDLHYEEGELSYHDTYLGGAQFAGEEALWDGGMPFWAMNYVGRVTGEGFSGDFLKEVLALAPSDRPFRGPRWHRHGEFSYTSTCEGDFGWFVGREEIFFEDRPVYECLFHGGRIRG